MTDFQGVRPEHEVRPRVARGAKGSAPTLSSVFPPFTECL